MRPGWPQSEAELARPVVAWLREWGWDVYQEVQTRQGEPCADIVARRGRILWVVECKLSLGLAVLGQARRWEPLCNLTSVAVPRGAGGYGAARDAAMDYLRLRGLGLFYSRGDAVGAEQAVLPRLRRTRGNRLELVLSDDHRTYAEAGNAAGRRLTPYRRTCLAIAAVVRSAPGVSVADLIGRVQHHYLADQTARACISRLARLGVVEGVEARQDGRTLRFYPREEASPET